MSKVVCFGEVLWDVFPDGKRKIGGAPLNVALRLASFDHNVKIISAVGNDIQGKELRDFLINQNLDVTYIQNCYDYGTGEVEVTLNSNGSATYTIVHPKAWDSIKLTQGAEKIVSNSDVLVFGSLIMRDPMSRETLFKLIELAPYKVFDLNLRPPHYNKESLVELMLKSDFIKFNDEELIKVCTLYGAKPKSFEDCMNLISEETNTHQICVTRGAKGAMLLYDGKFFENSGYPVTVADTVGAGDSFLGTLISELLYGKDPKDALNFACAAGALVAKSEGANPKLGFKEIQSFIESA